MLSVPMEKNYVVTSQEKGGASPGIYAVFRGGKVREENGEGKRGGARQLIHAMNESSF